MSQTIYHAASIARALQDVTSQLTSLFEQRSDDQFTAGPLDGSAAWSSGQHLGHLVVSIAAVNQAFKVPKMALRLTFGKPNRPGRDYDQVVQRYQERLSAGGRASGRYDPNPIPAKKRPKLIEKLRNEGQNLAKNCQKWKEEDLDRYLVPHPLLGKMTIREVLFFTVYHNRHHLKSLQERY